MCFRTFFLYFCILKFFCIFAFCNFFWYFSVFAEFAGDIFLLDSCLTTAQPLPRQQPCKEGQLMLTQWQDLVVCTSLPGDAQAMT